MRSYLDLLRAVVEEGMPIPAGATLASDGTRPDCHTLFGQGLRHDLRDGFPLLTTKRVWWQAVVHELVWFVRGDTNAKYLHDYNVTIWDEWLPADGSQNLGPIYGKQWRDFGGVDQLGGVLDSLRLIRRDPHHRTRRRLVVSAWNPPEIPSMALPPCHTAFQFLPVGDLLHCHVFCRSIDAFLGLPFNVASYAALTHLMAAMSGFTPGELKLSITDLHVYANQLNAARMQLGRLPTTLPTLTVVPPASLDYLRHDHFRLLDYNPQPAIRAEVAI